MDCYGGPISPLSLDFVVVHDAGNTILAAQLTSFAQVCKYAACSISPATARMRVTDQGQRRWSSIARSDNGLCSRA